MAAVIPTPTIIWNTNVVVEAITLDAMQKLESVKEIAYRQARALCPVDTGRLQSTIDARVQRFGQVVVLTLSAGGYAADGTLVTYAIYLELGVGGRPPRPFIRPAGDAAVSALKQVFR